MMAQCNGCLKDDVQGFCSACEKALFDRSKVSPQLNFDWEDIAKRIDGAPMGFSISGVQSKGFIGKPRGVELMPMMDEHERSDYIIKPLLTRHNLPDQSPANEHLCMQMARQLFGIKTADCAFVKFKNGKPAYLTRRFDYNAKGEKLSQEDFESVLEADNKYKSKTYQDVGEWLSPLNRIDLLRVLIFNYLTGNGDVHLKNISILETADGDMMLSPSYDLMNTKIHLTDNLMALNLFAEFEQTKLPRGEIYYYRISDFEEFGRRLEIRPKIVNKIIEDFLAKEADIYKMVDKSFMNGLAKKLFKKKVEEHYELFRGDLKTLS